MYSHAVEQPLGLHRLEFSVLLLLQDNAGCTAAKLAKALGISPPNMALWLERLTGRGLVERVPSETDRRSLHLRLSRSGAALARKARKAVLAAEAEGLSALSEGERLILAELLHKMARQRPESTA
jgi:DNA-binding MarR family transcriptional regulator